MKKIVLVVVIILLSFMVVSLFDRYYIFYTYTIEQNVSYNPSTKRKQLDTYIWHQNKIVYYWYEELQDIDSTVIAKSRERSESFIKALKE